MRTKIDIGNSRWQSGLARFWLLILSVSAVDGILEGRSRLFVERVLVLKLGNYGLQS